MKNQSKGPRAYYLAMAVAVLALLALFVSAQIGLRQERQALQAVAFDATPASVAAEHIKCGLANMDYAAANFLLLKPGIHTDEAESSYNAVRKDVDANLILASQSIKFGQSQTVPIGHIEYAMQKYQALIDQARQAHLKGDKAAAAALYTTAHEQYMYGQPGLLSEADFLDSVATQALEQAYLDQQSHSDKALHNVLLSGGLTVVVLLLVQVYVCLRSRRLLNLPLLAATVLTVVFLAFTAHNFAVVQADIKVVKADAFDSVHSLWRARAMAFQANGEESLYLLVGEKAAVKQAFEQDVSELAEAAPGESLIQAAAATSKGGDDLSGYLGNELRNITFAGEQEAATATVQSFANYVAGVKSVYSSEDAGNHQGAISKCVNGGPGSAYASFWSTIGGIDKTIAINQTAFDSTVGSASTALDQYVKVLVLPVLVLLLVLAGLRARIKDYDL